MHRQILSKEAALHRVKTLDALGSDTGFINGLREALNILETIASDIANGVAQPTEE